MATHTFAFGTQEFEVDVRYTNLKPLGRGAYGLVVSADDAQTGTKVAIKRVARMFANLIDAKRILREIKLLRHLRGHENIIAIRDLMTSPPNTPDFHSLYIVTDLFECDLERIISSPQPLVEQHARYFVYQVLRGLRYVHSAAVLHRDIKPSNLLVNSNCDLAICDFGLARGVANSANAPLTEYVVTRWYRAPELLLSAEAYGAPVDVWSVGCLLAEIIRRKPLLKGSSAREQTELIIALLGTPSAEAVDAIGASAEAAAAIRRLPPRPPADLAAQLPTASPLALDILARMLQIDPRARITVDEALAHPYFAELHSRLPEPKCAVPFDWSFEAAWPAAMPQAEIQRLVYTEMLALHEEQRAAAEAAAGARADAETAAADAAAMAADMDAPLGAGAVPAVPAGGESQRRARNGAR